MFMKNKKKITIIEKDDEKRPYDSDMEDSSSPEGWF